ncbi:MAG: hypothetical protein ACR2I0_10680, partial [Rhodoferax sp.]
LRFEGGMDGIELIQSLRALQSQVFIPALVVTGDLRESQRQRAATVQMALQYKPIKPSELRQTIEVMLKPGAVSASKANAPEAVGEEVQWSRGN